MIIANYAGKLSDLKIYCLKVMSVCKQAYNGSDLPLVYFLVFSESLLDQLQI